MVRLKHRHVVELTDERTSFAVGAEQAEPERDTLANRIWKLEVDVAMPEVKLVVVVGDGLPLKGRILAREIRANTAEAQAWETSGNMSALLSLAGWLNQASGG